MKEAVAKYTSYIAEKGGEVVYEEDWGLRKLAYPIQKKTTGFYHLIEFKANPEFIAKLETQFKRDERIIRFQTVSMDKHAIAYAERRRAKRANAEVKSVEE
jgi:small subunit ribosomal protein S6